MKSLVFIWLSSILLSFCYTANAQSLDVDGPANISSNLVIGQEITSPLTILSIFHPNANSPAGLTQAQLGGASSFEVTTQDGSGSQATRILLRGNQNAVDIEFYRGSRGNEQQNLIIKGSTGRVGVGIGNPQSLLHVNGTIEIENGSLQFSDDTEQTSAGQLSSVPVTNSVAIGIGSFEQITATCPAGFRVTGGGWRQNLGAARPLVTELSAFENGPNGVNKWTVGVVNPTPAVIVIDVTAVCAPVVPTP